MNEHETGAESWVVAGQDAPPEDPRISRLFGPVQETAGGAEIAVLRSGPRRGAPGPVGVVRVAGGRVAFHPVPLPARRAARPPRPVTFHALETVRWDAPTATLLVDCSKGTYIRALARDLGEAVGMAQQQ